MSVKDLNYGLEKTTKYDMKKVIQQTSEGPLNDILGYTENQAVSCDLNYDTHSFTFDAGAYITLINYFVNHISWCDNEFGYSNRVVTAPWSN